MYKYEELKSGLFTDSGQQQFLEVRDFVSKSLKTCGAIRMQEILSYTCGDSWQIMACVDRLVELDEIREITSKDCAGQHRVFVSKYTH